MTNIGKSLTNCVEVSLLDSLREVDDNDYNLNISRYVDTFEEEEPIGIHTVMKEIKEQEVKRANLDKKSRGI